MINAMIMRFARDERGTTMVEYAVLTFILSLATIGIIATIGDDIGNMLRGAEVGFAGV